VGGEGARHPKANPTATTQTTTTAHQGGASREDAKNGTVLCDVPQAARCRHFTNVPAKLMGTFSLCVIPARLRGFA
ncbi:MAG: hypothetical protein ACK5YE_23350, partial [Planctomyces sp.]